MTGPPGRVVFADLPQEHFPLRIRYLAEADRAVLHEDWLHAPTSVRLGAYEVPVIVELTLPNGHQYTEFPDGHSSFDLVRPLTRRTHPPG